MEKHHLNSVKRSRPPFFHFVAIGLGVVALASSVLTFLDFGKIEADGDNSE